MRFASCVEKAPQPLSGASGSLSSTEGPTRARAEGPGPYRAPEVWDLLPDALDDTASQPKGWERGMACDLIDISPTERIAWGASAPYLNMAALPANGLLPNAPSE